MGDTKLSTGRRNFLPKLYFTLNSGTWRAGRGVIRFDSERHDHFLEILMENFDF